MQDTDQEFPSNPQITNQLRDEDPEVDLSADDEDYGLDSEEDLTSDDEPAEEDDNPLRKSCDEFRQLLNSPITEIALDISPPGHSPIPPVGMVRSWTDQYGNVLANGSMVDLRRGYVILESGGGRVKIPYARLSDADWAVISEQWRIPLECGLGHNNYAGRHWIPQTFTWKASSLCHKPLYFENIQLERYGHFAWTIFATVSFGSSLLFQYFLVPVQHLNQPAK